MRSGTAEKAFKAIPLQAQILHSHRYVKSLSTATATGLCEVSATHIGGVSPHYLTRFEAWQRRWNVPNHMIGLAEVTHDS